MYIFFLENDSSFYDSEYKNDAKKLKMPTVKKDKHWILVKI